MATARPGLVGNTLGSLAIVALVGLIAFGLPAYDRSLPATRSLPAGATYAVGAGVTLVPPPGATVDVSQTRPGDLRGTALFTVGTVRYAVVSGPFTGGLGEAANKLREQITGKPGYQVAEGDHPFRTDAGVDGRAGGYTSPGRTGEYAVFVAGGRSVEVTVSAPDGELRTSLPTVEASVRTVIFEPQS